MLGILQQVLCGCLRADLVQFWGGHFGGVLRGPPTLKTSGIGRLLFLGLCWTYCNRFQVVTFPADLAQFWGYR